MEFNQKQWQYSNISLWGELWSIRPHWITTLKKITHGRYWIFICSSVMSNKFFKKKLLGYSDNLALKHTCFSLRRLRVFSCDINWLAHNVLLFWLLDFQCIQAIEITVHTPTNPYAQSLPHTHPQLKRNK